MTWSHIKRVLKIIAGFALLPLGVIMLALPGPGWLTIVLALAILAGEFVWARKLLDRLKEVGAKLDPRKKKQP
jgi:tellurite resistance protein TerC